MKAMVLEKPNQITLKTINDPRPQEGQVLIRTTHAGICGSDAKIYEGKMPASYPVVMGHEIVGEVITGDTNSSTAPGTRVLIDPVNFCGKCYHCLRDDTHLCPHGVLMGREINGGFADYCVAKTSQIYPLPSDLNSEIGAVVQVLTTVLHAQNKGEVGPGGTVVILGLGVAGLMHIQLAKTRLAQTVIGVSRNSYKRDVAISLGADCAVAHGKKAEAAVMDMTDGIGADIVIECVGHLAFLGEAIALTRPGGRIVPFGVYPSGRADLPFYEFYFKELEVVNARAAKGRDFVECIDLVSQGKINLSALITHKFPFTDLNEAIKLLIEPSEERLKVILERI